MELLAVTVGWCGDDDSDDRVGRKSVTHYSSVVTNK